MKISRCLPRDTTPYETTSDDSRTQTTWDDTLHKKRFVFKHFYFIYFPFSKNLFIIYFFLRFFFFIQNSFPSWSVVGWTEKCFPRPTPNGFTGRCPYSYATSPYPILRCTNKNKTHQIMCASLFWYFCSFLTKDYYDLTTICLRWRQTPSSLALFMTFVCLDYFSAPSPCF